MNIYARSCVIPYLLSFSCFSVLTLCFTAMPESAMATELVDSSLASSALEKPYGETQQAAVSPVRNYSEAQQRQHYEQLLEEFGQHKTLPEGFELQALIALSHYPELKTIKIRFIVDDVSIPLSSRPYWASLHRSGKKRTYLVVIDSHLSGNRDVLLLKNQPFNAQIGILGHELAHAVYYLERSLLGIIGDGLCQLSSCRIEFERDTDRRLITYGLGWQRLDHASFVRRRFAQELSLQDGTTESQPQQSITKSAYMDPAQLQAIMVMNPTYGIKASIER